MYLSQFCIALVLLVQCNAFTSLTNVQVRQTTTRLTSLLTGYKVGLSRPLIPGSVRLAFHDCVGGCDGCVNLDNADNSGLQTTARELNKVYDNEGFNKLMSRADFWALASVTALDIAAGFQECHTVLCLWLPRPEITFRWGRKDCPTSPSTSQVRSFPDGHGDLSSVKSFGNHTFGLNLRETVALLGAHTLGTAQKNQSGWNGKWVWNQHTLSNLYYQELISKSLRRPWTQINVGKRSDRWQWNAQSNEGGKAKGGTIFMLNTDMSLYKDIKVDSQGRSSCPTAATCGASETASIMEEYAANNALWMKEFSAAFEKMISYGYDNLAVPN
ncbi:putative ascorbate peroxidase [Lingula anatina]|uniref:Ascorbate peroxidase n=1 Tax=Lingula anatina TaxID=7574 RepID=A0A1S3JE50_LINAN|nr:putative ascorbate peroxidase [Lingula anatina]|eukprot:XP_013408446.1 putative ascorbate peroxidase [Lingula anatina]